MLSLPPTIIFVKMLYILSSCHGRTIMFYIFRHYPFLTTLLSVISESLLRRQRLQLDRLQQAIIADHARIVSIRREIQILEGPAPVSNAVLQRTVQQLRDGCQVLNRQIEANPHASTNLTTSEGVPHTYDDTDCGLLISGRLLQDEDEFSDDANRRLCDPIDLQDQSDDADSWKCHVCTFRNHALLNKCEQCDMPRIILGRTSNPSMAPLRSSGSNSNTLELSTTSNSPS